jgi:hypothetical protein
MQVCPILFWIGVAADLLGIFFLAGPDFVPEGERLSRLLRRGENRVRRFLGRSPRAFVINAEAGSYITFGLSASGMVGPGPRVTTIDQKVEYLLRRDEAAQRDLNAFGDRVKRLEDESPGQVAKTEQELKEHVARELAAAHEKYRPLRQVGAILLVGGVVCLALATLLG